MFQGLRNLSGNPYLHNQMTLAFTGPRLGIAFFLVGAALSVVHLSLYADSAWASYRSAEETAQMLMFGHHATMLGLLLLLLPIKVSGSIEGPRLSGVFDQLVGTGLNPPVMALGAWASGMFYAGMLLVASLPFAACLYLLVDVPLAHLVTNYVVLLIYSNVILAVTLAASTLVREYGAVPGTIAILGAASMFALIPDRDMWSGYPAIFAELTPARMFFTQVFNPDDFRRMQVDFAAEQTLFFWSIPLWLYRIGLWSLIIVASVLIIKVGPGHRFSRGLNSFGTVTTGGRMAGLLRRLRAGLTRRVELAFFYENAPAWTHRWGFAIRAALVLVPLLAIQATFLGATYLGHPYPMRSIAWNDELWTSTVIVTAVPLLLWAFWACEGRSIRELPVTLGGRKVSRELFVFVVFGALFCLWLGTIWLVREQLLTNAAAGNAPTPNPTGLKTNIFDWDRYRLSIPLTAAQVQTWTTQSLRLVMVVSCIVLNVFLITRAAAHLIKFARGLALLVTFAFFCVPILTAGLLRTELAPPVLEPVTYLSPAYLAPNFVETGGTEAARMNKFLFAQILLTALLLVPIVITTLRGLLRRRPPAMAAAAILLAAAILPAQGPDEAPQEDVKPQRPSPLVIESATRGFDGTVFGDHADFFTVIIRNDSDRPIEGDYWFETRYQTIRRRPFHITGRSKRTLRFRQHRTGNWWGNQSGPIVFRFDGRRIESQELYRVKQPGNRSNFSSREQQHLFVQETIDTPTGNPTKNATKLDLNSQILSRIFANNAQNAVACRPEALPLFSESYVGLEAVWLTAKTLTSLQSRQRTALYRYALVGGTVILYGGVDDTSIPRSGPWAKLLTGASTRIHKLDDQELRHVALFEGRDVVTTRSPTGADIPILNLRNVGQGRVAHASFLPVNARTPQSLQKDVKFWLRWNAAVIAGRVPISRMNTDHIPQQGDWTSMGVLGFYLGGYTLIVSLLLALLGWRKRRSSGSTGRRWFPPWLLVSLLFSAAAPLIVMAIRSVPTSGRYIELTWFGPHSTQGVVSGELKLRSGGKTDHEIEFHENNVFARERGEYGQTNPQGLSEQLANAVGGASRSKLNVQIPAWSNRTFFVAAPREIEEPFQCSAIQIAKDKIRVQGTIPKEFRGMSAYAAWFDPTRGDFARSIQFGADGKFQVDLNRPKPKKRRNRNNRNSMQLLPGHNMWVPVVNNAPRLVISLWKRTDEQPHGLKIQSDDLDFELDLPRRKDRPLYFDTLPKLPGSDRRALRIRRIVALEVPIR